MGVSQARRSEQNIQAKGKTYGGRGWEEESRVVAAEMSMSWI